MRISIMSYNEYCCVLVMERGMNRLVLDVWTGSVGKWENTRRTGRHWLDGHQGLNASAAGEREPQSSRVKAKPGASLVVSVHVLVGPPLALSGSSWMLMKVQACLISSSHLLFALEFRVPLSGQERVRLDAAAGMVMKGSSIIRCHSAPLG